MYKSLREKKYVLGNVSCDVMFAVMSIWRGRSHGLIHMVWLPLHNFPATDKNKHRGWDILCGGGGGVKFSWKMNKTEMSSHVKQQLILLSSSEMRWRTNGHVDRKHGRQKCMYGFVYLVDWRWCKATQASKNPSMEMSNVARLGDYAQHIHVHIANMHTCTYIHLFSINSWT